MSCIFTMNGPRHIVLPDAEHLCRGLLRHPAILPHLCQYQPDEIVSMSEEDQGFFGRSDFCLTVQYDDGSSRQVVTYIWELKAPRCALFRRGTKNRLTPSRDLVEAENQLMHYVYEAKRSGVFQKRFRVDQDNIHPGGIIIGRRANRVAEAVEGSEAENRFDMTKEMREFYFYNPHRIRLWMWDKVVRIIKAREGIERSV